MAPATGTKPRDDEPDRLHDRALHQLEYIRDTIAGASRFTAVPGRGIVLIGLTALAAAFLAARASTVGAWVVIWLSEAAAACAIGLATAHRKARSAGEALFSAPGRRAALAIAPPLAAGAVLTLALWGAGRPDLLPGTWLLLYGAGVIAAGAFSVSVVPVAGAAFFVTGIAALLVPVGYGDVAMAAGFGAGHLISGFIVARNHGG
jgi:hypothetical protein